MSGIRTRRAAARGVEGGEVDPQQRAGEEQEDEDRPWEHGDRPRREGDHADRERGPDHARSRTISPRRPLGRKIRIRIRTEKAKMSLYSAPKAPPVSSDR